MMETLELAQPNDIAVCYDILDQGRAFQREQGFMQWTDSYPNPDTIRDDIQNGTGYVVKVDGEIAGYMCIDFAGEPAYRVIEGRWHAEGPYAVVHRMSFSRKFRGRGLTGKTFPLIESLCLQRQVRIIRIDTGLPNQRMQHILEKNGFCQCGIVYYQNGQRIAYDKVLPHTT